MHARQEGILVKAVHLANAFRLVASLPTNHRRWNTNVCQRCPSLASTNAAGKTAAADCGCPSNYFSSTDTPDTTGCQPCPSNSYRNLASTTSGDTVDLKGATGLTSCTCNPNYWWVCAATTGRFVKTATFCLALNDEPSALPLQVGHQHPAVQQVPHRLHHRPYCHAQGRPGSHRLR